MIKRLTKNIGLLLLAIWLILTGLASFVPVFGPLAPLVALLAIAAGIFILAGR